jgi:hypothetical protein
MVWLERIKQPRAGVHEIGAVARDEGQLAHSGGSREQAIDRGNWIADS